MSYTPEQLREWAYDRSGIIDADWLSDQLRAHADALEELTAEREKRTKAEENLRIAFDTIECRNAAVERLEADLAALKGLAEAMAGCIAGSVVVDQTPEGEMSYRDEWSYNADMLLTAYRRDFPRDEK